MGAAPLDELPGWALELLGTARAGHLGLIDDRDRPRVLPVTFALARGAVWSAVDQKPKRTRDVARVRYLRRRPEAALTVDHYDDDWSRLAWVQALGRIEVLEEAPEPALSALRDKYAPYRQESPRGPFLRLAVERTLTWSAEDAGG